MIAKVGTVSVFVEDQDRAKEFYTAKLGMELRQDQPLFPGAETRWVAVAPAGAQTEIVLYKPDENWAHYKQVVGNSQAVTLDVDDMSATYDALKARGVIFKTEPLTEAWGTSAFILDSEGNSLLLVETPKG